MKQKQLLILMAIFLIGSSLYAQEKALTLDQALQALESNAKALKLIDKDISISKEQLEGNKQFYLPKVGVQYTGIYTNSPLNSFGFKLNQEIVQQSDFDPTLLNNPDGIANFNTKFQILQPILNFDAKLAKEASKYQVEALEFQKVHTLNHLKLQLQNAFVQLQTLYAAQQVLQESESALNAHLAIVNNFIREGLGKTSDQLAIQVKIKELENRQLTIQKHIGQLSSYIAYLTGDEATSIYKPTATLESIQLDENAWPDSIQDTRADLMAYQKGIEAQQVQLRMTKAQNLPRLNAFGEFNFNDQSPVGFGGNNYLVGARLSWQLHLGKQLKSKVNSQQLATEKANVALQDAKEQSNMELRQAIIAHQTVKSQIDNLNTSVSLAKEQLRITKNRFKEGLEKSADVLLVENQLSQAKLAITQLYAQLKQHENQIEFLLSGN